MQASCLGPRGLKIGAVQAPVDVDPRGPYNWAELVGRFLLDLPCAHARRVILVTRGYTGAANVDSTDVSMQLLDTARDQTRRGERAPQQSGSRGKQEHILLYVAYVCWVPGNRIRFVYSDDGDLTSEKFCFSSDIFADTESSHFTSKGFKTCSHFSTHSKAASCFSLRMSRLRIQDMCATM